MIKLSGVLAKYLCLPELAQETYSTTPVGAINRVDNEGDRDPSNRTGTQHLPLRKFTIKRVRLVLLLDFLL